MDMPARQLDAAAREYFSQRYEAIIDYGFVTKRTIWVFDHDRGNRAARRCRFCGRGPSEVTFKNKAHAGPEFLGSKTIRTLNECDECNDRLGREYESHLGNRLDFLRSVSQVKGKGGAPSYENPSRTMRIDHLKGKQTFALTDKSLFHKAVAAAGPFSFDLPTEAPSQKHVPLRAFKALVKVACSVCPREEVDQCERAIQWLMTGSGVYVSSFLVLRGFTPGPREAFTSKVLLLRRRQPGSEPYLWCVLQVLNHRFQFFVPSCPADDAYFLRGGPVTIPTMNFRLPEIEFDWPFGESEYWREDWSSDQETQVSIRAAFRVLRAEVIDGPQGVEGLTTPPSSDLS
jgi:hypothetical protein